MELVYYIPPGAEPQVCAAFWQMGDHVHLASPWLPPRCGARKPQSDAGQFPDALASIKAFEDSMTWLDAACYAAADSSEVEAACQQHPEWRLQCIQYDGRDASLRGLSGLIRASETANPFPGWVLREFLLLQQNASARLSRASQDDTSG